MSPWLKHITGPEAAKILDEVSDVYATTHSEQDQEDVASFRTRAVNQFQRSGVDMVTARTDDGSLVGFVFGLVLQPGSTWWLGITPAEGETLPDDFAAETGTRTFAVIDLVVLPDLQGQGLGKHLLSELLHSRREERATLATDPSKPGNQAMYERWGWQKAGRVKAAPDAPAPFFDLYVLPLSSS